MFKTFYSKHAKIKAYQVTSKEKITNGEYPGIEFVHMPPDLCREELSIAVKTIHGTYEPVELNDYVVLDPDGIHHYTEREDIFLKRWSETNNIMSDLADLLTADNDFRIEFQALLSLSIQDEFEKYDVINVTNGDQHFKLSTDAAHYIVKIIQERRSFKDMVK